MKGNKYKIIAILIILVVAAVSSYFTKEEPTEENAPKREEGMLYVHFIDVGEADSTYIELPDGKTMLIDAGEVENGEEVANYIADRGTEKIDFLVGTHPHSDHIGGLATVVNSFDIGNVYMPKAYHSSAAYENVITAIKNKNMAIDSPMGGEIMYETDNLLIEVLSPNREEYDNLNNYSIVIKLTYGETSFLFTGDAEDEVLREITGDVSADVLKVAHHGSNTSSDADFMKRVSPRYAVIPVGENNQYGHPHWEVTELLAEVNAKVYRTDENGTVVVSSDGENIDITTWGRKNEDNG